MSEQFYCDILNISYLVNSNYVTVTTGVKLVFSCIRQLLPSLKINIALIKPWGSLKLLFSFIKSGSTFKTKIFNISVSKVFQDFYLFQAKSEFMSTRKKLAYSYCKLL